MQKIDELEKAGDMQREFVSDVSHELRTPVTTMRMAVDMLSMHKDGYDATTRRTVELLDGQIRRFQEMLADLLEISRFDAGYAALDLTEGDVREPISQARLTNCEHRGNQTSAAECPPSQYGSIGPASMQDASAVLYVICLPMRSISQKGDLWRCVLRSIAPWSSSVCEIMAWA